MNEIAIRLFAAADCAAAIDLWRRCEGVRLREADSPQALGRFLARNPGCSFVAAVGEAVVGTALCGHDGRRGFLYHVAVDPERRRSGIGRVLVERCLAALAAEGIDKCHLLVVAGNAAGRAFWERLGWSLREDVELLAFNLPSGS